MKRQNADFSLLGPSTRLSGNVIGEGSLRVEGSVRGDIAVSGSAEIAEGANLEGNLSAEAVEVSGILIGNIAASGPIAIGAGALVRGEVRGSELSAEPGSRLSVKLDTDFELDFPALQRRK